VLVFGTALHWARAMLRVRISPNVTPVRIAFAVGGLLCLTPFFVADPGVLGRVAGGLGFAIAAIWLGLDRISALPRPTPNVALGDLALDFSAPDSEGGTFTLSEHRGHPVLLKFFRGHW